jgi:hypothetical protein
MQQCYFPPSFRPSFSFFFFQNDDDNEWGIECDEATPAAAAPPPSAAAAALPAGMHFAYDAKDSTAGACFTVGVAA